jgi:hypothetical protein
MKKFHKIIAIPLEGDIKVKTVVKLGALTKKIQSFNEDPEDIAKIGSYGFSDVDPNSVPTMRLYWQPYQLILLSDDMTKADDGWCYDLSTRQVKPITASNERVIYYKKVIAAYPTLDNVLTFTDEFLKEWVKNPVSLVEVEYDSIENTETGEEAQWIYNLTKAGEVICKIPEPFNPEDWKQEIVFGQPGRLNKKTRDLITEDEYEKLECAYNISMAVKLGTPATRPGVEEKTKQKSISDQITDGVILSAAIAYETDDQYHLGIVDAFVAGAKSEAAKQYWTKKYIEENNGDLSDTPDELESAKNTLIDGLDEGMKQLNEIGCRVLTKFSQLLENAPTQHEVILYRKFIQENDITERWDQWIKEKEDKSQKL